MTSPIDRPAPTVSAPLLAIVLGAGKGTRMKSSQPKVLHKVAGLSMLGIMYALVLRVFTSIWVEGWTALMIAVLFIGGVQLICVGILGDA